MRQRTSDQSPPATLSPRTSTGGLAGCRQTAPSVRGFGSLFREAKTLRMERRPRGEAADFSLLGAEQEYGGLKRHRSSSSNREELGALELAPARSMRATAAGVLADRHKSGDRQASCAAEPDVGSALEFMPKQNSVPTEAADGGALPFASRDWRAAGRSRLAGSSPAFALARASSLTHLRGRVCPEATVVRTDVSVGPAAPSRPQQRAGEAGSVPVTHRVASPSV